MKQRVPKRLRQPAYTMVDFEIMYRSKNRGQLEGHDKHFDDGQRSVAASKTKYATRQKKRLDNGWSEFPVIVDQATLSRGS